MVSLRRKGYFDFFDAYVTSFIFSPKGINQMTIEIKVSEFASLSQVGFVLMVAFTRLTSSVMVKICVTLIYFNRQMNAQELVARQSFVVNYEPLN